MCKNTFASFINNYDIIVSIQMLSSIFPMENAYAGHIMPNWSNTYILSFGKATYLRN